MHDILHYLSPIDDQKNPAHLKIALASRFLPLAIIIVAILCLVFAFTKQPIRLMATFLAFVILALSYYLVKKNRYEIAMQILWGGILISQLVGVTLGERGLHDIGIQSTYPILIAISIFLGGTALFRFGAITIVWALSVYTVEIAGWRNAVLSPAENISNLVLIIILIVFTVIFLRFTIQQYAYSNEQLFLTRNEAQTANKTKDIFLANMSHELRTPLNAIIGYSELLSDELKQNDFDRNEGMADLERIQFAGRHLLSLVNNLLDLSKIEAGKIDVDYEPTSISPLIFNTVSTITPFAESQNNTLHVQISPIPHLIELDQTKTRQILLNLLKNANQFTENGRIDLNVYQEDISKTTTHLVFKIQDNGIGISSQDLDSIFTAFTQLNHKQRGELTGVGLGLAITKQLVEILAGTIGVNSIEGQGTTFTVRLPFIRSTAGLAGSEVH